jgi:acetolactate synthase-1/3 small subunit
MTIETEVLLLKVSINKDTQTSVIEKANLSGARSVDVGQDYAIFEMTGTSKDLNKFEKLMKPFGIIEMVRGGRIAIQSNL